MEEEAREEEARGDDGMENDWVFLGVASEAGRAGILQHLYTESGCGGVGRRVGWEGWVG